MKPNEPSTAMLAFLRETAPDQVRGEIPASEEEVRFETAWAEMLARKRHAARQTVKPANEVVTEPFDLATFKLYRRPSRKPVLSRLAVAVVAAVVVGGLSFALRSNWWRPGPIPSPAIVEKDPPQSKGPGTFVVDKGKGVTDKPLPPFKDALSGLKKRLEAGGMDEQEALLAYEKLLELYPGNEAEIKGDRDLAFAVGLPVPPIVNDPNNPIKPPESAPLPVAEKSSREEILARIAVAGNPPPPRDAKVRESREQALRFREEHPELKIPEIEAFIVASELSPRNELRYAEARAKELEKAPKDAPEVRELRGVILALRLRDETRPLVLPSKPLAEFMRLTQLDDLAAKAVEMKTAVLAIDERFSSQKGRGPYLLCVLPPGIRDEAYILYRDVQAYARNSADPLDPKLVDFLIRARRPMPGDTVEVIVPSYNPTHFTIGTAIGNANWDRLIDSGNPDVKMAAVINIVINREILLKQQGINDVIRDDTVFATITRAKAASITMLACLDCTPGVKSDASLIDEIDSWVKLYGNLDGFFVYNASNDYFFKVYKHIRDNYGARPFIAYSVAEYPTEDLIKATIADKRFVVCIERVDTSIDNFKPPAWVVKYNPNRFAGVFRATQAELATSVDLAAAKYLGSFYLSDNGRQIPEYLPEELALVQQLNARIMGLGNTANPAVKKKKPTNPKGK